jgi:protein-S-isoprenylcysteine O-methyltransferase Ste14
MRQAINIVFSVGWIAFWIGWMAAASRVKRGASQWRGYVGFRLLVAALIVAGSHVHAFRGSAPHDATMDVLGLALFVVGIAIAVWARVHLGRNWGTPMSQKEDPELVTSGPYRWVRNPIYSGLILAFAGTGLAVDLRWLIPMAPIGAYFVYSAVKEQRYMEEQFPDTYPAYRASTRMLIPFIY